MMEYRLLPPMADTFEYSLVRLDRTIEEKKKLAQIYEKMFKEASKFISKKFLIQGNFFGMSRGEYLIIQHTLSMMIMVVH